MPVSNVGSLNRTLQETQEWLKELAGAGSFHDEEQAYTALRAVLHSVRDRLTVEEAVHFSAQFPMLVRGFYFEGWRPALAPNREETAEQFHASVEQSLRNASLDLGAEHATRGVLGFLERKMDPGQIRHVKEQMPKAIRSLWPGEA